MKENGKGTSTQPCTKPRIQLQGEFTSGAPHQYIREWVGSACIVCSIPLLPSMLGGVTPSSVIQEVLGEAGMDTLP